MELKLREIKSPTSGHPKPTYSVVLEAEFSNSKLDYAKYLVKLTPEEIANLTLKQIEELAISVVTSKSS